MSLRDHVPSKYVEGLSGRSWLMKDFDALALEQKIDRQKWINLLRSLGIKAAHPDDGWVNREENSIRFAYPSFNDHPRVGDLIVLGSPSSKTAKIVRVIKKKKQGVFSPRHDLYFEELTQ